MGHTYNGDGGSFGAHDPVAITVHDDADQASAAVFNAPLEQIADLLAFLQEHAALRGGLETAEFDGQSADTSAALELGGVPLDRKLKARLLGDGKNIRLYVLPTGELEIVHNAAWNGTGWARDAAGGSSKLTVAAGALSFHTYPAASASPWLNSAWVLRLQLPGDGRLAFVGTTTGASGSNPPANTALANTVCAKNTPKAWATVDHWAAYDDSGSGGGIRAESITLEDGFNVSSVERDTSSTIKVTFAQPMKDATYAVTATKMQGSDTIKPYDFTNAIRVVERSASYVRLAGDVAETTSVAFALTVFGVQDS